MKAKKKSINLKKCGVKSVTINYTSVTKNSDNYEKICKKLNLIQVMCYL